MLPEVALVLSIIEHIDPVRFKNCPEDDKIALVHEVLTIIGANTINAYAYSKSPAGARGLFQLVPDTYKRLRDKISAGRSEERFCFRLHRSSQCGESFFAAFRFRPGGLAKRAVVGHKKRCSGGWYVFGCGVQLWLGKSWKIGEEMRKRVDMSIAGRDQNLPEKV